jgi:pimeloyl-ACP methyl ester carboxylesterase
VLMLHGSGGGLHSWEPVATRLADEREVWLVARRGHGPSDAPDQVNSFADEVADVHAILGAVGASTAGGAHLVGASYGATLGLHTALIARHALRSLSLYEPPLFAAGPDLAPALFRYRSLLERDDPGGATLVFLGEVARVPPALLSALTGRGTMEADPGETLRSAVGRLHDLEAMTGDGQDLRRWSAIQVPTLLMQGADTWDPMPASMDALAAALRVVERVVWHGQAHFATATAPDLVAETLRAFLARQDQRHAP